MENSPYQPQKPRRGRPKGAKNKKPTAAPARRPGRPSKCTPDVLAKVVEGLSVGLSAERACARAGITRRTYLLWRAKGEQDDEAGVDSPEREFFRTIDETLAEFAFRKTKELSDAGTRPARETNTAATIFLLRCRFREDYSPTTSIEVSGPGGTPLGQRDVRALTDEELEALAKEAK